MTQDGSPSLEDLILAAPVEDRERLARHFSPSAIRLARERAREAALLQAAEGKWGTALAIAAAIHAEIERYRVGVWRFERGSAPPTDERRKLLHRILTLSDGDLLSIRSLRKIYAPVAKKTSGLGHTCVRNGEASK